MCKVRIHDGATYDDFRFDSIFIVNDRAELHGTSQVEIPARMYVFTDKGTITTYLSNGHEEVISGAADDIDKEALNYEGAPWSNDMMSFNREIGYKINEISRLARKFRSMTDEEKREYSSMARKLDSLQCDFFMRNPNSWHVLTQMEYKMMDMPKEDVRKFYDALEPDRRESRYGKAINGYLNVESIAIGDRLSDFNIIAKDQNGNEVNLANLTEPYILIDFSQVYCGPCIAAAKEIHEIKEKYAGKVAFINYSCDNTEANWRQMVKRDAPTWPSLFDGSGATGEICLKYGVNCYPTFFLFGPDRTLLDRTEGYAPDMLDTYLSTNTK